MSNVRITKNTQDAQAGMVNVMKKNYDICKAENVQLKKRLEDQLTGKSGMENLLEIEKE
jgi:hypothetical protein